MNGCDDAVATPDLSFDAFRAARERFFDALRVDVQERRTIRRRGTGYTAEAATVRERESPRTSAISS